MSLDVYIKYRQPKTVIKRRGINSTACGSTIAFYPEDSVVECEEWHANITHNMTQMASQVPVSYRVNKEWYSNLYMS